jgi:hypothetical protein
MSFRRLYSGLANLQRFNSDYSSDMDIPNSNDDDNVFSCYSAGSYGPNQSFSLGVTEITST